MSLLEELVEIYLFNEEEVVSVYNRVSKEVSIVTMPGEFSVDWNDEEATKDLVLVPQLSSTEAYELMVSFANEQEDADVSKRLLEMLSERKPFENFKSKLHLLGLGDDWYDYENDYARKKMTTWLNENS